MRLYHPTTFERLETNKEEEIKFAIESGYTPSVTSVADIINPGEHLTKWKIKNSLNHFKEYGDFDAALNYENNESSMFGTRVHNIIENYLNGIDYTEECNEYHFKTAEPMKKWIDENVNHPLLTEERFCNKELGFSGTLDFLLLLKNGQLLLGDLKVKKHSSFYPMKPMPVYKYQLSAYRKHLESEYGDNIGIANFLLSSPFGKDKMVKLEKYEPVLKVFNYGDNDWYDRFQMALTLWKDKYS